jgi:hypothetical protein
VRVCLLKHALEERAHCREGDTELLRDVRKPICVEERFRGSRFSFRQPVKLAQMAPGRPDNATRVGHEQDGSGDRSEHERMFAAHGGDQDRQWPAT